MKVEVKTLSTDELARLGVEKWPVWEADVSEFPWEYSTEELCYIIEGRAQVSYDDETVEFKKGDFVVFPKGLKCVWKIIEPIRKYYSFR